MEIRLLLLFFSFSVLLMDPNNAQIPGFSPSLLVSVNSLGISSFKAYIIRF